MPHQELYDQLANHLSMLGMGYPVRDTLVEILKANFSPDEARVALALPTSIIPLEPASLEQVAKNTDLPPPELGKILEGLAEKGLLYSGRTADGSTGYALQQVGFGFPQTFYWRGEETEHGRRMLGLVGKYFNRETTREAYGPETKPYRYIPLNRSIPSQLQAVLPQHAMEKVISEARSIAVGHCPCRIMYKMAGRECPHPTEVCIKFNDLADYVIERGFARPISREEALEIMRTSEEAGLVHFVDNAGGDIQHNCNCCGCACWNVGSIRRRKIPRDALMATYFLRETDEESCIGCGNCADICPVAAVRMEEDLPVVDLDWCIGCGVCAGVCPTEAITMGLRTDRSGDLPAESFKELHRRILQEKEDTTPPQEKD